MVNPTNKSFDQPWSSKELSTLSEFEITKLSFQRDTKNIKFFLPMALFFYYIGSHAGLFGKIIGWIGIALFTIFALEVSFHAVLTVISLIGTPILTRGAVIKNLFWKSLQLIVIAICLSFYAGCAALIYSGIYNLAFSQLIP